MPTITSPSANTTRILRPSAGRVALNWAALLAGRISREIAHEEDRLELGLATATTSPSGVCTWKPSRAGRKLLVMPFTQATIPVANHDLAGWPCRASRQAALAAFPGECPTTPQVTARKRSAQRAAASESTQPQASEDQPNLPKAELVRGERRQRELHGELQVALDLDLAVHEGLGGVELAAAQLAIGVFVDRDRRVRDAPAPARRRSA